MMNTILLPERTPPQLQSYVADEITLQVREFGVNHVARPALENLQNKHDALGVYLDEFGMEMNMEAADSMPGLLLQYGASLAIHAYAESGYKHKISEQTVSIGQLMAEANGIPTTFLHTAPHDPVLLTLSKSVAESVPELKQSYFDVRQTRLDYSHILDVGFGCGRYFLQQELSAT